jgi:uncharacterized protein (DUF433 family)
MQGTVIYKEMRSPQRIAQPKQSRSVRLYRDHQLAPDLAASIAVYTNISVKTTLRKLCRLHPAIAIDPDMVGGVPHLKGLRLSVGDILAKLYVHGNTDKLVRIYEPDLKESQVKEAIAFAQEFLEEMSGR